MAVILRWILASAACALIAAPAARVLAAVVGAGEAAVSRSSVSILLAPAAGACLVWLILRASGSAVAGTGTDLYIATVNFAGEPPPVRVSLLKHLATMLTVGTGGSGGLVGPALLIGSGTARAARPLTSLIAPGAGHIWSDLPVVGAGAMLGALLGAPFAGGLLAVEVLRPSGLYARGLAPALMGSWAGFLVHGLLPSGGATAVSPLTVSLSPTVLALSLAVALLSAACGVGLVWLLATVRRLVGRHRVFPWSVIPGALAVGLLGLVAGPEMLGWGLPRALESWAAGDLPGWRALLLLPAKMAATALTVGTGGSGGVIAPALVIGALGGAGVCWLAGTADPVLVAAGMAACLAAASNVPLAAAVLMVEWMGPGVTPVALIGSGAGYLLGRSWVAYSFDEPAAVPSESVARARTPGSF